MPSIEHRITELWGQITAATHHFLELIAELDRTEGWAGAGMTSCAQWLNLHCGIGEVAAREKLRVAHALGHLPQINAAFRAGSVSYSKVRAMTRVATAENEATLLTIARYGTASHVERTVRQFRRFERLEAAELAAESHRQRSVRFRWDDDDSIVIHARLPADVGELVKQAIERAAALVESDQQVEPGEPDYRFDARARGRAEGLRLMAEQFLAMAGEPSGPSANSANPYQVVVHIDQRLLSNQPVGETAHGETLRSETPLADTPQSASDDIPVNARPGSPARGLCELQDGPALAIETARRLACDNALVGLVEDAAGHPLNVGRKTRAIPQAIKRALKARDGGCRFPGCTHTRFTEGHHIQHWANGGETRLDNLVTLCHFHHHLVHEGGYAIAPADDGTFAFRCPDGTPLPEFIEIQKCFRGNMLPERNRERGIHVDSSTIDTRWLGERMDYSMAIDAMIAARERSRTFLE